MASDVDRYMRTPPCALHRTFRRKFNRPNYFEKPAVKVTPPKPTTAGE